MADLYVPTDAEFKALVQRKAARKGFHRYSEDRWGRRILAYHPDGRPYEACPACSRKAMTRTILPHDTLWECHYCGYEDCAECPLGIHQGPEEAA